MRYRHSLIAISKRMISVILEKQLTVLLWNNVSASCYKQLPVAGNYKNGVQSDIFKYVYHPQGDVTK